MNAIHLALCLFMSAGVVLPLIVGLRLILLSEGRIEDWHGQFSRHKRNAFVKWVTASSYRLRLMGLAIALLSGIGAFLSVGLVQVIN